MGILGVDELGGDAPLMEAGLDSLSSVDFRNSVAKELPGVKLLGLEGATGATSRWRWLPSTLMFDHPNTNAIAAFAAEQLASVVTATWWLDERLLSFMQINQQEPPQAKSQVELQWQCMVPPDGVTEIPLERWDVDQYFDEDAETPGMMTVRHGAFVKSADLFDASFFGLSPAESKVMDPQQRLLLEVIYQSFHVSGKPMGSLSNLDASVCVGQCNNDWGHMGFSGSVESSEKIGPYTGLAVSTSISSNRVSYLLGLKGPSATVDTACSSSLVAVDIVVSNLRRGRSSTGAASGVNLCLIPGPFVACSKAHMLSEDGRCKTFDASANGYVRGEGCGSAILSLLDDGRSSSQTAPHGPSQQAVIITALSEAQVEPGKVSAMETHGTGTALGDPIEVGALKNTYGEQRSSPLALCAVMSMLPKKQAPPNLHFQALNPHCDLEDFPSFIPSETLMTLSAENASSSGLSSFGFGGTNTHVLLEDSASPAAVVEAPVFKRQSFSWQQRRHALLQRNLKTPEGVQVFAQPFAGKLLQLVSHHIIFGEIVVPGATYLEMVLAAGEFHLNCKDKQWSIRKVGFTAPLVLKQGEEGKLACEVDLYLELFPDQHWSMSSYDPKERKKLATHAEGDLDLSFQEPQYPSLDLTEVRQRCDEEVSIERLYVPFSKIGLPLQPRFRTVRHILRGEKEVLARIAAQDDGTNSGYLFNPAVIDGTFQGSMAFMLERYSKEVDGLNSLRIPLMVQKVTHYAQGAQTDIFVHHELVEITDRENCVNSKLCKEDGTAMLGFETLRFREVRPEHIVALAAEAKMLQQATDDVEEDILQVEWSALEGTPAVAKDGAGVLFVGREPRISGALEREEEMAGGSKGAPVDLVSALAQKLPKASFVEKANEVEIKGLKAVIHLAALEEQPELVVLEDAVLLAQVGMALIAKGEDAPQMAYVTWGTQDDVTGPGSYLHAGLWGLARTIRMEERTMKLRCFDLDSTHLQPEAAAKALVDALGTLLGMGAGASESELSLRGEQFKVSRLSRSPVQVRKPMRLQMSSRGSLSNLRPVPQVVRPQPGPGQVELRIRAIGLNFRDVLNVMGMYPGDPGNPGGDCAGTVCSIAQGEKEVAQLRPGHDVFGIAWGCLQTYACTEALLLAPKPKAWSFEQMAAWSVTFATTEEAFQELAPLKKGERVLIHAATGGVGLVAVQFAQRVGATIFATAGSPGKVKHLQDLGAIRQQVEGRDEAFEEDMKRFMKEDGADAAGGLDVVLNSLSHDDYIPKSLGFLRKGGRFMEIGKRLIWSHEQMQQERPDVQYEKIAMDWVMEHQPERYNVLMRRLVSQIEKGWWKEVPLTCYEGLNSGIDAMRYLQRAQQIGKVVLTQPSRMQLKEDGRYVLSGGVGALGLVTTQMLAEEGAKSVVLLSRRGVVGDDLKSMWEKLQDFDLELQVKPCDVASFSHVQEMVMSLDNSYRMRGLIHLAAVLDDATLPKLTRRHLEKAYGAKVFGARHLRLCLSKAQPLDFSMLFSSTSALLGISAAMILGSPGQGNYSAANMALDAHARYWKALGETVVAVQWGPWREVGMAANKGTVQRLKSQGLGSIGNTVGMAALAGALGSASPVVAACPVHWGQYLKQFGKAVPPFYSRFRREAASASPAGPTGGRALALGARAAPAVSADQVQSMVLAVAGEVTGSVAVEFRNRLSNELPGIKLPNTLIFDYPTVSAISMFAASQLSASPAQAQPQARNAAGISAQEVEAVVLAIAGEEPLMDSGMDSLAAVEFRNRLSNELQGVKLPNTLIFDYPTVSAISNFAASQVGATSGSAAAFAAVQGGPSAGQAASISGMAATLPGRRDEGFWEDLLEKKDSVVEIPFTRWDLEMYYSPDPDAPGKTYAKHGGFIEGAELFDPSCFGLSAAEASSIDPQQRLLLEAAHTAFTAAGRDKDQLMGAEVGVFVGQCQYDWFVMVSVGDKFNPYTGTGISASISANRTSYIFGIKGPSVTCDTACSSSLVAADAALSSLRRGTAEAALAAGTNLILGTGPYISFSKAKMLSEDGRCFTFDASANGYARGEGVGAALLSLDDAGAVAVRASLAGAAANQDGRSASLTAPNGPSQQAVIRRALLEASTDSKDVGLIECHGTGTALGDPIEVDALKGVLGESLDPLVLGAAKTNIAHLEGSAGIAGFLKSVHMLEKRQAPPNLHFQSLNPHIDMEDFPAVIPTELQELPSGTLASGLSSFGFGGTNAHLTFVAAPKPAAPPETAIAFRHASFPWRETAYRCLRRKIMEGRDTHFECTIKSDLFKVCAEHVAFGEIVVPGVVYVEHAMEAVKTIVGKEGYLKDLAMTWPLVIPKNADEPTATTVFLRFCQTLRFSLFLMRSEG
ncbi:Polyketide synthase PksJ (PKS) [Durusdinium trenchii]|uniref:Polyketide synthase PksJ (PKS) n=1 Tax=Durusdinium trenchii TaxID=1381693 RepID=A0ABP0RG11_9DINO